MQTFMSLKFLLIITVENFKVFATYMIVPLNNLKIMGKYLSV